jgi:integrase
MAGSAEDSWRDAFMDHLRDGGWTPGHIEGTEGHFKQFISILGNRRVASLTDADMAEFKRKREKKVTPDTIRANFKSLNSAVNWAIKRNPPLLKSCPFSIPSVSGTGRKPFLPTEEIERLLANVLEYEQRQLLARWVLDLDEVNGLIKLAERKMPEMTVPLKLVCSTGMRRIQLIRLRPADLVDGTLTVISKKGAREKGLAEIHETVQLRGLVAKELRKHVKTLPKRSKVMFPVFEAFDYSGINKRWKGKNTQTPEQRRCDRADRLAPRVDTATNGN